MSEKSNVRGSQCLRGVLRWFPIVMLCGLLRTGPGRVRRRNSQYCFQRDQPQFCTRATDDVFRQERRLPLVFSLHGDGGPVPACAPPCHWRRRQASGAVFIYPNAPGGTFEYYTYDGRSREAVFVTDVIAAMQSEFGIDTTRVFVVGFSGGATMTNALGCRLGPGVIRGLGIHSGTFTR